MKGRYLRVLSEVFKGIGISLIASALFSAFSREISIVLFLFVVFEGVLYIIFGALLDEFRRT